MDKYLVVNLNMFSLNSEVLMWINGEMSSCGSYSVEVLPDVVVALAHESDTYHVKVVGSELYAMDFIESLKIEETIKYSETKIEVEVL